MRVIVHPAVSGLAIVELPGSIDLNGVVKLGKALRNLENLEKLALDFKKVRWANPFPLLMLSSLVNEVREARRGMRLSCINHFHLTYFAHIGFFWTIGEPFGKHPGEAEGGPDYLPISVFQTDAIRGESQNEGIAVGAVMDRHAEHLSGVLSKHTSCDDLRDTLTFSIREMLRNVVEHSNSKVVAFCAQYFRSSRTVEVGINDWGEGLATALSQNSKIGDVDDRQAINLALMPGVSGKADYVRRLRQRDDWTNSGYGLYMTSRICREGGSFLIGSHSSMQYLSGSTRSFSDWGLRGTAIRLVLREQSIASLSEKLKEYRKEASIFVQKHGKLKLLDPSTASTALAREFKSV